TQYYTPVDYRPVPLHWSPCLVPSPLEVMVYHDALGHEGRAVPLVEREIRLRVPDRVAEYRRVPLQLADVRARVRVEHQLVCIEAMPLAWRVGAVNPRTVHLAGTYDGQVAVPDLVAVLGELDALRLGLAALIEQTKLDLGRGGREQGEVDALTVPEGSARMRQPLFDAREHD